MGQSGSHWVFGYGSLMWNPGFAHLRAETAKIEGFHRRLCVCSFHYRGQPAKPGLVFGLDKGGVCEGLAFEVAESHWPETLEYLRQREQITMVYNEIEMPVRLVGNDEHVKAITYVVDRTHPQCACGLADADIVKLVQQGEGLSGPCTDYVRNTHAHLEKLGLRDQRLDRIMDLLANHRLDPP